MSDPIENWKRIQNDPEYQQMAAWSMVVCVVAGALLYPYAINAWMEHAGKDPAVVWWQGALLGLLGPWSIPLAVVTWILLLIL